jgi:hypothetical protein
MQDSAGCCAELRVSRSRSSDNHGWGPATTRCLEGRERRCRELLNLSSERVSGCPLATVRYPRRLADRACNGHRQRPGCGSCAPPLLPIGLTAADLFAGGKVSRADSRVRQPGTFPCARRPAVTSALDAAPQAHHNPAAVWGGPCTFRLHADHLIPSRHCQRRNLCPQGFHTCRTGPACAYAMRHRCGDRGRWLRAASTVCPGPRGICGGELAESADAGR